MTGIFTERVNVSVVQMYGGAMMECDWRRLWLVTGHWPVICSMAGRYWFDFGPV